MCKLLNFNLEITQEQKDLIFGSSLGDGFLFTRKGINWRYEEAHSLKQKDYLFLKFEILKPFCGKPPYLCNSSKLHTNSYQFYRFVTKTHDFFAFYGKIFYNLNTFSQRFVKDVPSLDILMIHLTPRAIAYWYMDDGALYYGCLICTESFSLEGLNRIQTVFFEKYGISISLKKLIVKKVIKGYRLYVNPANCEKFVPLIKPYILPSMLYKLPEKYR